MDSRDPEVVFFEKSVIQSITLLQKWDL